MDLVHERAVGIDISKRDANVCVRVSAKRKGQFTSTATIWGSTTKDILKLCWFVMSTQATLVAMEATRDCWKPFYYLMEESLPVVLVNGKSCQEHPVQENGCL